MKTKFARPEKLNQKNSCQTLLFLQGHSNYISAYKRLKVANSQKSPFKISDQVGHETTLHKGNSINTFLEEEKILFPIIVSI
jgi:hypothetical protein